MALATGCTRMPLAVDATRHIPLTLAPASFAGVRDQRANFRDLFCREPGGADAVDSEACDKALRRLRGEGVADRKIDLSTLPRERYGIAVALGVGWDCVRELIDEERLPVAALRAAGYDAELLEVEGLSGSERNADIVAEALVEEPFPSRRLIVIGYSKGVTDLMVALRRHPELAGRVAALVSVAGSVGGSPVANNTDDHSIALLRFSPFGDCSPGDGQAMASLRPALRHAWIEDELPLPVPVYSLVAAPDPERVSPALRSSFKLLGAVHPLNDGALLHWDQLLPGSTLLGYANADHWAVAVPIDVDDIPLSQLLVKNGYPRNRLWRAIADFVVADLESRAGGFGATD
jgi:hypothetical protein